jgi:uncharacterized membrane protein
MINRTVWCDIAPDPFGKKQRMSCMMMDCGMMGGGMMIAMGLIWFLIVGVLVLAAIALVKYIRSDSGK